MAPARQEVDAESTSTVQASGPPPYWNWTITGAARAQVPADCRIIKLKTTTIKTDEGALTGESETVLKQTEPVADEARFCASAKRIAGVCHAGGAVARARAFFADRGGESGRSPLPSHSSRRRRRAGCSEPSSVSGLVATPPLLLFP